MCSDKDYAFASEQCPIPGLFNRVVTAYSQTKKLKSQFHHERSVYVYGRYGVMVQWRSQDLVVMGAFEG